MNFRSIAQLSDQLVAWSRELPHDIDLVVGLPRSGMLVANIFALHRNLPVTDLDGFLAGRTMGAGRTRANPLSDKPVGERAREAVVDIAAERFLDCPRRVLVLDDSIWSGTSLREAKAKIEAARLPHCVRYGAVYVTPETTDLPDHYCEVLHHPRCFEWNVLHHHVLRRACIDLDGVLCVDPQDDQNDDGERYRDFLRTARPLHLPTSFVGHIVTNRLERYRPETERWLADHGIEYGELVMLDYPDGATRRAMRAHGAHKAKVYRDTKATFFIESDVKQAVEIATLAKKEVLCIDTMQMIRPGSLPVARPCLPLVDDLTPSIPRRIVRRVLPAPTRVRLDGLRRRLDGQR